MNNTRNTSSTLPSSPYNFYFADHLNLSIERKDSRSSSISSQRLQNSLQQSKIDQILESTKIKNHHPEQSLLDGIDQNQFIIGYTQNIKNTEGQPFNNQNNIFHDLHRNQQENHSSIPKHHDESENQNSFLLDTQTYKEICIEEHQRKSEFVSSLDVKSSSCLENKCEIHDNPLEIVCIEDRCLICSHCAIFGDHKTHSLAPLKHIEKFINQKEAEVNDIITNYKSLQLGIKQKVFLGEFSEKINQKKNETKLAVDQSFKLVKQFISSYECEVNEELERFYGSLENKITDTIKRISLDSNKEAFQQWQRDASSVITQISFKEVPKMNRINIFLNNFVVPEEISNCMNRKREEMVSLEIQGNKYLDEMKEQLNLNINNVMKTVQKFKVNLNNDYPARIKQFISFECESHIEDFVEQNNFRIIQNRLQTVRSLSSIRESFNQSNDTRNSVTLNIKQAELASTFNSMTNSTPIFNLTKASKRISAVTKNYQFNKEGQFQPHSPKKPLKFKRRETLEDARRMQVSVRSADCPFNLHQSKSVCQETVDHKRRISPCLKNMVKVQNEHLFVSQATTRLNRCSSRETANIYSPFGFKGMEESKDFKRKSQILQVHEPLKVIQNYQRTGTQTFDLSNCNLSDTEIIYFVQKASKIRKIKHLKLTSNMLTSTGLQRILPYLSNCNLMNLSNNRLTEMTIDLLLRKKQRILQLKMLNLSNNKLNERKIREKIVEFKKMGIVVTL